MPRYRNDYEAAKAQGRLWTLNMARGGALKALFTAKTGIVSSTGVSTWRDQSAYGWSAAQATAAKQPGYVPNGWNGALPALQFISDGTSNSDDMSVSGLTTGICGGRPALFALIKPNAVSSSAGCAFWRGASTQATGLSYYAAAKYGFSFRDSADSWTFLGAPNLTTNKALWGMWVPDSNTGHVIVDGSFYTATSSGGLTVPGSGDSMRIGQDPDSDARHYDGLLATVAAFDGTLLTRAEVDRICGALMWEWQIQDSLPAGHLYRNRPPLIGG